MRTLEEFRRFCKAFDELQCFSFNEEDLCEESPGVWKYRTTARDECNTKEGGFLYWSAPDDLYWDGFWPETSDEIRNLLQAFLPPSEREFTLYVKVTARYACAETAERMMRVALDPHKNFTIDAITGDARTAQFS